MKIIKEKEDILKRTVRDAMAINPLVSIRKMQDIVKVQNEQSISDKYTSKLMKKVRGQVIIESDHKKINERLAEVRERYRTNIEYLTRCIYWKWEYLEMYGIQEPTLKEKLNAIKLQTKLEDDLFKSEIYAGMFEIEKIFSKKATDKKHPFRINRLE